MENIIAHNAFNKYLTIKGIVKDNDLLDIKRLDFGQNWTVFLNKSKIGNCSYNANTNRFEKYKPIKAVRRHFKSKTEFCVLDYIRKNRISIKR